MAVTLTKSYQRISTISLTYGEIRTYAKYSSQSTTGNTTSYQIKSTYYTGQGGGVSFSSATAKLDGTSKSYGYTTMPKGETTIQELSRTLTHNSNGSSPTKSISTSWSATFGGSGSASGSIVAPKINRIATVSSATDMTDESNPSVSFSNPGGMSLVPYINFYKNGSVVKRIERTKGSYSSPYNWNITETERQQIRQIYNDINTGSYTIGFDSYSGSTKTGYSSVSKTITIVNANPIFSNFEFEDVNPVTLALTGDSSVNVNGYSNIKATISTANKAIAQKEATMTKYQFKAGGSTPLDISYSDENAVYGTINNSSNGIYKIFAIDSRQNSTPVEKIASSEIDYKLISLDKKQCSFIRDDNQVGEYAELTLNGTIWNDSFGVVTNSIKSVTYRLKKTDSSTWINGTTTITPTVSGNTFTFSDKIASDNLDTTWDLDASYNLQVTISDELSSTTAEFILNSAIPTISLDKQGVGIMCGYNEDIGGPLQLPFEGGQINVLDYYSSKLIASYEFENASNSYTFNDLHLVPDKVYKFKLVGEASGNGDMGLQINNISSTYYQSCWYVTGTNTSSNANYTFNTIYRPNKYAFYAGMGMRTNPCLIEGTIQLRKNGNLNKYYPFAEWRGYCIWTGTQFMAFSNGALGTEVNEITSLTFTMEGNYNFKVGTKIQIIEIRDGLTI